MALVYVIIPVYNARKTLRKCIKSLQNQTITDINIFLIDDGSTDGSGEICDKFAEIDSRITVVHKTNGGAISARNTGIKMLPEEGYATFCDADDLMPRNGIEILYHLAVNEKADITSGTLQRFFRGMYFIRTNIPNCMKEKTVYEKREIMGKIMPSFFGFTDFPGYMPTKLYKNHLLKKSEEFECPVMHFQEDIAFNLQMCILANRIAVLPDTVYYYRMGGSTSRFMPTFLDDCVSLYKFKNEQIEKYRMSNDLKMTSAIELINELWTWLVMYYEKYARSKGIEWVKAEIGRCCLLPSICEALSYNENELYGVEGFYEKVKNNDRDRIFEMLLQHDKKTKVKRFIKKVVVGV